MGRICCLTLNDAYVHIYGLLLDSFMNQDVVPIPHLDRIQRIALFTALIGGAATVIGLFTNIQQFYQSYLFAYLFILGLSTGAFGLVVLHYLVGGEWGAVIRRILEAAAKTLWLVAVLFIPFLFGLSELFPWARAGFVAESSTLQFKHAYLNEMFFTGRALVYFGLWLGLTVLLTRWARRGMAEKSSPHRRRFQRVSAFGLILYVLTMTFASLDWIMSLDPEWFSTIFGFLTVAGQVLAAMSLALLLVPLLAKAPPLKDTITTRHFRDLGALTLAIVMVWAYFAFSQYLIIWSGNIPREVIWYLSRATGGWLWLGVFVIAAQFVLPFLVLLSLRAKQNPRILAGLAAAILIARLIDNFWQIAPAFHPEGLAIHWLDIALPLALSGLWALAFIWHLRRTPQPVPEIQHAVEGINRLEQVRGQ